MISGKGQSWQVKNAYFTAIEMVKGMNWREFFKEEFWSENRISCPF